jgi:hypothetical protein
LLRNATNRAGRGSQTFIARHDRCGMLHAQWASRRIYQMDLTTWMPGMFVLGLAVLGACYLFLIACEKI